MWLRLNYDSKVIVVCRRRAALHVLKFEWWPGLRRVVLLPYLLFLAKLGLYDEAFWHLFLQWLMARRRLVLVRIALPQSRRWNWLLELGRCLLGWGARDKLIEAAHLSVHDLALYLRSNQSRVAIQIRLWLLERVHRLLRQFLHVVAGRLFSVTAGGASLNHHGTRRLLIFGSDNFLKLLRRSEGLVLLLSGFAVFAEPHLLANQIDWLVFSMFGRRCFLRAGISVSATVLVNLVASGNFERS